MGTSCATGQWCRKPSKVVAPLKSAALVVSKVGTSTEVEVAAFIQQVSDNFAAFFANSATFEELFGCFGDPPYVFL